MRGLDMQVKMGDAEDARVCRFEGLAAAGLKTLRGPFWRHPTGSAPAAPAASPGDAFPTGLWHNSV